MTVLEISPEAYHRDEVGDAPALSASIANLLLTRSPRHAYAAHPKLNPLYRPPKAEERFDVGTALHALLLEGRNAVVVVEADSWRSNAAKEARELARADGMTPLLRAQWDELEPMFEALRYQLEIHSADPRPFTEGKAEQTLVWEEKGVTCKARLDWLRDDRSAINDLKTTRASAEPRTWARTAFGMGADVQCAMYLRGARAYGWDPVWAWVVIEVEPPYALSVCTLDAAALAIADDKVDRALTLWRQCLESGDWPAYSTDVARLEPLPWAEAAWLERREELVA